MITPLINGHQFGYNLAGWFIIPFFCIQIFNLFFRKIFSKINSDGIIFVIYLALGLIGMESAVKGSYQTWYGLFIDRICYLLPFYGFGTWYRSSLEAKDHTSSYILFPILFAMQLIIITVYKKNISYTPAWCNDFDNAWAPYIIAFLGILFWLRVTRILCPVLKKSRLLMKIGNSTYSIMINQFIFMMAVKTVPAIVNKISGGIICDGFDFGRYKSEIYYLYVPGGLNQWKIVYLAAGVLGPVVVQDLINWTKKKCKQKVATLGMNK